MFVTKHEDAINDIVKLQIQRSLPDSLKSMVDAKTKLNELVNSLAVLPRPSAPDTVMFVDKAKKSNYVMECYNCGKVGHLRRACRGQKPNM